MAAYVVVLVGSELLLKAAGTAGWRYPVALLPVLPLGFAMLAYVRFLRRMDELQRRIQLDALTYSFGASALITIAYGFLEQAGLPAVSWVWVAPLMIVLWGASVAVASRRYS